MAIQRRLSSALLLFGRLGRPDGGDDPQRDGSSGLARMCFTEHMDFDFPVSDISPAGIFEVNLDSYLYDLLTYREKYRDRIRILFGLELGLQAHLAPLQAACAASKPFDFIIGSSHLCAGKDPYQPYFWEGRSEEEALREYFSSIIENLETFTDFDIYGHLDYVVRYAPQQDKDYCYENMRICLNISWIFCWKTGSGWRSIRAAWATACGRQTPARPSCAATARRAARSLRSAPTPTGRRTCAASSAGRKRS